MEFLYRGAAFPLEFLCVVVPRTNSEGCQRAVTALNSSLGRSGQMLDFFMLAISLGFFVLAVAYTYACDQL